MFTINAPAFTGLRAHALTKSSNKNIQASTPRVARGRTSLVVEANKRVKKETKVVLLEASALGAQGEMVSVANGYFRSYLEPKGLATLVSQELMAEFKARQEAQAAAAAKEVADAKAIAVALQTIGKFVVKKSVGAEGKIFGSVQGSDVVAAIKTQTGKEMDAKIFVIPDISSTGVYEVEAKLHKSVKAKFQLEVQKE
jgi:large subunit ribosomal protein L9